MKEMTLAGIIAIFEAMFGVWLWWLLVIVTIVTIGAFFFTMFEYKRYSSKHFYWAKISAPIGAFVAVVVIFSMTHSTINDIGGPIDLIVLVLVAIGGAIATTILAFLAQANRDKRQEKNLT